MRRVQIDTSTFKLSMPGVDVAKATPAQLIFDGFGGYSYNGVYISGLFPSTSMVRNGNNYQGTVNFGKTFAAPPQCVVRLIDVNHQNARMGFYLGVADQSGSGGVGPVQYIVSTTSLFVNIPFSGSIFPAQVGFSYAALQI